MVQPGDDKVNGLDPGAVGFQELRFREGVEDDPEAMVLELEQGGAVDQLAGCGEYGPLGRWLSQVVEQVTDAVERQRFNPGVQGDGGGGHGAGLLRVVER